MILTRICSSVTPCCAFACCNSGRKKAHLSLLPMLILGFFGGAFIALGYLLDIHVIGTMPKAWGSFTSFLGAAVFPIGLI
ncbi:formate/nitrite transporter family protein, partial [Bacillus sp. D-CC]